jgi:hypothetical protein
VTAHRRRRSREGLHPVGTLGAIVLGIAVLSGCGTSAQPRAKQSADAGQRGAGETASPSPAPPPTSPAPAEAASTGAVPAEAASTEPVLPETPSGPRHRLTMDDGTGLSMIPPSAFMAVFARPRAIVESPALADTFQGDFLRDFVQQRVVNPHEEERYLWLFWGSGPTPQPLPAQCVVGRYIEGYKARQLLETYWEPATRSTGRGIQERIWEGVTYYRPPLPGNVAAYLPDERTLLLTAEASLQYLLTAAGEPGPLADKARKLDLEKHAVVVLVVDSFEPHVEAALASMEKSLPSPLRGIAALAGSTKTNSLSVDLDGDVTASLVLEAKEPGGVATLAAAARDWVAGAENAFAPSGEPAPGSAQQARPPLSMLLSSLFHTAEVVEEPGQVVVRFRRPKDFGVLLARAVQAMIPRKDLRADLLERGRRLRAVARAMLQYNDRYGHFPVWASRSPDGTPLLSWRVHLLPFLGEEALYKQFHLDEPWDSQHNAALVERMPAAYRSHDELPAGKTSFAVFVGEEAPFGDEQGIRMVDVWDGPENTIMVVEAGPDKAIPWTKPEDLPYDAENPVAAVGHSELARFLAAYFDGTVHGVTRQASPEVLRRLIKHHDSLENLPADSFVAPTIDFDEGDLRF